jgi:hypothetical protein
MTYKVKIIGCRSSAKVEDDDATVSFPFVLLVARLTSWGNRVIERELEPGLLDRIAASLFFFALANLLDDERREHIEPPSNPLGRSGLGSRVYSAIFYSNLATNVPRSRSRGSH